MKRRAKISFMVKRYMTQHGLVFRGHYRPHELRRNGCSLYVEMYHDNLLLAWEKKTDRTVLEAQIVSIEQGKQVINQLIKQ